MVEFRIATIVASIATLSAIGCSSDTNPQTPEPIICPVDENMILVPYGIALIGSTEEDIDYYGSLCRDRDPDCGKDNFNDELPQQSVEIGPFCINPHETTNDDFAHFVEMTGHITGAERRGASDVWNEVKAQFDRNVRKANWKHPRGPKSNIDARGGHPVVHVDYADAKAYCEESGGRLPNAYEWEVAARGREGNRFPWGNDWDPNRLNWAETEPADTRTVTSYPDGASPFGVNDTVGNVAEWTDDVEDLRRGGSFPTGPAYQHPSWHPVVPLQSGGNSDPAEFTSNTLGFRCVKDVAE